MIGTITKITEKEAATTYEVKAKEKVIGTIDEENKFSLGDKVQITGEFYQPTELKNFSSWSYQDYLKRKKIFYLVNIKTMTLIQKNKNLFYFLKEKIQKRMHKNPYLYTFLLGDKAYLSKEVIRSYQENGISHLFAISGMHISLLSTILKRIGKRFCKEESLYKGISLFLLGYLLLVGPSPSIVRGVLFFIFFEGNKVYYFYIKKENLFLTILSLSLLWNPYDVLEVGFAYSYLISYSLLKMSKSLSSSSKILALGKVSALSFFVSLPITLFHFYQINILSILYNIFYVPYVSTILFPMSLIVFLLPFLSPIYEGLCHLLEASSLFLSKISIGKLLFQKLPIPIYILYFIGVLFYVKKPNKKILIFFISMLSLHFLIGKVSPTNYLQMIDVGQGDCFLLHINQKNIVIDTGGKATKEEHVLFYSTILPTLRSSAISKIDYLILSHGDYDHMGEADAFIENLKVKTIILNRGRENTLEKSLIKKAKEKKIRIIKEPKELKWKKATLLFLEHPLYENENDNSIVMYGKIDDYQILFMGDAGKEREQQILEDYQLEKIDILKVGHHGSNTSSLKTLIEKIEPKISLISVGKNNRYGHPNKETLEVLKDSRIYRTDQIGGVKIKFTKRKLRIFSTVKKLERE